MFERAMNLVSLSVKNRYEVFTIYRIQIRFNEVSNAIHFLLVFELFKFLHISFVPSTCCACESSETLHFIYSRFSDQANKHL